ncbi:MAG: hypothetical protein IKM28_05690 [Lachnospiraceae bacterium]|nr:hypothetical protein [Lachnospiraceae bacterium]
MIMVNIYVPTVDREYDFSLDQNVKIETIITEIGEMISRKEQSKIVGKIEELILCDKDSRKILRREDTLAACGICTGSKLILI